jgi:hypothetical protein
MGRNKGAGLFGFILLGRALGRRYCRAMLLAMAAAMSGDCAVAVTSMT